MAEDGEPYDHLPDWQQEQMELAIDLWRMRINMWNCRLNLKSMSTL